MSNIVFEHKYTVEGYITFNVKVISNEFSGASSFCVSEGSLRKATSSLSEMYEKIKGSFKINDYDSNDFILFEFMDFGHLRLTGQIGGSYNPQHLNYQFVTDQTVLKRIIMDFKNMINPT